MMTGEATYSDRADVGPRAASPAERAAVRLVNRLGAFIEKSRAETDPRQKIACLENAKAIFEGLCGLDGVHGRFEGRAKAEALLAGMEAAPTATPATVAPAGPSATSPNWTSYLANNPDVMAWAQSGHGDPKKPIDSQSLEDRAMYHYYNSGMSEGRKPFAAGGVFTNGIVSQPTGFNMGLMGEAGPEAIMPLVRGPNGLGVRSAANDDGAGVAAEVRQLRSEVARLNDVLTKIEGSTRKTSDVLNRVSGNAGGDAFAMEAVA